MKSYKSFSAGVSVQAGSDAKLMYTVPSDCSQAKLTFIAASYYNCMLGIKKNGGQEIVALPAVNQIGLSMSDSIPSSSPYPAYCANVSKTGMYLDPSDSLYALSESDRVSSFYVSGLLEYES